MSSQFRERQKADEEMTGKSLSGNDRTSPNQRLQKQAKNQVQADDCAMRRVQFNNEPSRSRPKMDEDDGRSCCTGRRVVLEHPKRVTGMCRLFIFTLKREKKHARYQSWACELNYSDRGGEIMYELADLTRFTVAKSQALTIVHRVDIDRNCEA